MASDEPLNECITHDLFVASFDLLWHAPEMKSGRRSSAKRVQSCVRQPSLVRVLFSIILLKCNPCPQAKVECHDFPLEALDHPAIIALIEYKWNTIGYMYWLARFIWQFIFYSLVLVAVFMEVYDVVHVYLLKGVYIGIIVMACMFLHMELRQFVNSPRRYLRSPYNMVDIAVFALPFAGCVLRLVNMASDVDDGENNASTLSFSVLLIFLHILFELRVIKIVCYFVAIIISIIGRIRVFFLLFAAGILAFATAILHLLRGCPVGDCQERDNNVKFPLQFHRAISSTYFLMGGIWDSVDHDMEEGDWTVHTMMVLYYMFTSLLLLNVLIALMNVAFNDGDEKWLLTWRESRLRCIEGAETITYHIPGFRDFSPWFPKKIYYFASEKERNDYWAKHSPGQGLDLLKIQEGQRELRQEHETSHETLAQSLEEKHEELKRQHEELKQRHEMELENLKQELTKAIQQQFQDNMEEFKEMCAFALSLQRSS
ncbi:hypothetical protein B0O80DRAFT_458336 [Mortierella sp. GBAus27b]|nr:hypothetical protein B0O80DRAFT_458336 [Mortierella sp. GBAus27b]